MERNCFPTSPRRYEPLSDPDTGCSSELTRSANCEDVLRHSANAAVYDCTAWTDVKHNLYLYQLEMSFVKELQHSKCLHAYQYSQQKQKDLNVPRKQFNISKIGFWKKINRVRAGTPKLLKLCNTIKNGKRTISYGLATSSPKFSANKPLHGGLCGLVREGMGQNFSDGDNKRKSDSSSPTKRWKRSSDGSS